MTGFAAAISAAYATEGDAIVLGRAVKADAGDAEGATPDAPLEHVPAPRKRSGQRRAPAPSGGGADAIGDFLRSRQGKALHKKVARRRRDAAQALPAPVGPAVFRSARARLPIMTTGHGC